MIQIGKGLLTQINEIHEFSNIIDKEEVKKFCMSISDEGYENLWKETFGETYEEFIDKMLEIER